MKFTALGGANEVGASCSLLQVAERNIVVDAGVRVNRRGADSLPDLELLHQLTGGRVDLILVTHAHTDHIGALPLVHARYGAAPILTTVPTKKITRILLRDAVRIMSGEEREEEPLFDEQAVEALLCKMEEQRLAQAIGEVIRQGGSVLFPSFALGRAQEIILILKSSIASGLIPKFPIFVDGMVRSVCDVFTELVDYLPTELKNWAIHARQPIFWQRGAKHLPPVLRLSAEDRPLVLTGQPKVVDASSGMLIGGPIVP